jgi:hypothetical protein
MQKLKREIIELVGAANAGIELQEQVQAASSGNDVEKLITLLDKIEYTDEMYNADGNNNALEAKADKLVILTECLEDIEGNLKEMVGPTEREFFYAKKDSGIDETVYHHDFVGPDCVRFTKKYKEIFERVKNKVETDGNQKQIRAITALNKASEAIWSEWKVLVKLMKRIKPLQEDEKQQIRTLSLSIPLRIKKFIDAPPVKLQRELKYPEMIKLHCYIA